MCSSSFFIWPALTTESIKKHSVGAALPLNYSWAPDGAVIICFTSGTSFLYCVYLFSKDFSDISCKIIRSLICFSYRFVLVKYIGTSGRPKGVTLSHSAFIIQSLAKIAVAGYGEDDVRKCSFRSLQLGSRECLD